MLHSTAQLYSHKRKHERREFENAYRSFRSLQSQQVKFENEEATPKPDTSPQIAEPLEELTPKAFQVRSF